jgi:hypothetical protein
VAFGLQLQAQDDANVIFTNIRKLVEIGYLHPRNLLNGVPAMRRPKLCGVLEFRESLTH